MRGILNNNKNLMCRKTSKVTRQARSGIIGSLYPHLVREMAPGSGDGPPPPGRGNLPPDKPDDEEGGEEEGEDTDEETESVTSSSQGSMVKPKHYQWKGTETSYGSGAGGPPEDPNDPFGEGSRREGQCGPRVKGCYGVMCMLLLIRIKEYPRLAYS